MEAKTWFENNLITVFSVLFGSGSIAYLIINKLFSRAKYNQEVRKVEKEVDLQSDEFWKKRYEVLEKENKDKDAWWKERYENLYSELQTERGQNNEIFKNFREQLSEIRQDYENQIKSHKEKYNNLFKEYQNALQQSDEESRRFNNRINSLEEIIKAYEKKLCINCDCENRQKEQKV
jgi:DNA repair exonuclease SbcCD ATPase subunit